MNSFFDPSGPSLKRPLPLLPQCGSCGLYKTCKSPKMKPTGKGKKKILIVGEAPGKEEDKHGVQFVGPTGRLLRRTITEFGINPDRDCFWTNAIICRPPDNRIPSESTVGYCRPNLLKTIEETKPEVIILLGGAAVESLIGWLWKDNTGGIGRWMGFRIPSQRLNAWICPAWHPSYVERSKEQNPVVPLIWRQHLKRALAIRSKPYINAPRLTKKVETIVDTSRASTLLLKRFYKRSRPVAFDYETNCLKPDSKDARIVCCSMSNGKYTIAYPWHGEAIKATKKILESSTPKIGYNIKFEHRWSGLKVNNWLFDGQLGTHILDNRKYITSLKFQAFVNFGQEDWSDEIRPYLSGEGGNGRNRIHECDLNKLLLYCGMDSLLEWMQGKLLMKRIGLWRKSYE